MYKHTKLRRTIQAISLLLFLSLLVAISIPAAHTAVSKLFSIFLLLDPLSVLATSLAARELVTYPAIALFVIVLSLLFGRVFCGYICPMGTTVDIIDKLSASCVVKSVVLHKLNALRIILFAALLTAALFGVNLAFHLLPISLATRLYGLVAYPFGSVVISEATSFGQNFGLFDYFSMPDKRYSSILFIAAFVAALFIASRFSKRFWCSICPTGVLLGLLARFSPYKRAVSTGCTSCSNCQKACPTGSIKGSFVEYQPQLCISCKKCVDICPAHTVSFGMSAKSPAMHHAITGRREALQGIAFGGAAALLSMTELKSLLYINTEHGDIVYAGLLRPPGAVPEAKFLAKCIRCGQCMLACPTNGLQPLQLQSGSAATFSPVLVPLRGKCDTACNICGVVCPTGAIIELSLEEKQHAKIGTARVQKERCLAWEENRACMVCDEVCPYNAMSLTPEPGYSVTVPRVDEARCFGCGACENSCPLAVPAVVVEAVNPLRLDGTNYIERSRELGLDLTVSAEQEIFEHDAGGLPPGFTE